MTTEKYFICCEKCFETIALCNTGLAKAWMDLCAIHLEKGQVIFAYNEIDEVKKLEKMGFLTSTDTDIGIHVRVRGQITTEGEVFFCAKGGLHE